MHSKSRQRAWEYYQHADNLIHNRHNIFIVAQSIFVAAFTQASANRVKFIIVVAGSIYAICWSWLSMRLARRMRALDRHMFADQIYREYVDVFKSTPSDGPGRRFLKWLSRVFSAHHLLNWILPMFSVLGWMALALLDPSLSPALLRRLAELYSLDFKLDHYPKLAGCASPALACDTLSGCASVSHCVSLLPSLVGLLTAWKRGALDPDGIVAKVLFWPHLGILATMCGLILLVLIWRQGRQGVDVSVGALLPERKPCLEVKTASGKESFVTLRSIGDPFTLVTRARLLSVSHPHAISHAAPYQFIQRKVLGGDDVSTFRIASLGETRTEFGINWLVKVRGEGNEVIQRWEGNEGLSFDIEWTFQSKLESVLETVTTIVTHVALSDDAKSLIATILDTNVNSGQLSVNTGAFRH